MTIQEARKLVGQTVVLRWTDRHGSPLEQLTPIYKADYVPMYGPCLFTDAGEINLDKIVGAEMVAIQRAA